MRGGTRGRSTACCRSFLVCPTYPSPPLHPSPISGIEVEKSKSISRSNWQARPLSASQLKYSALDVKHLPQLADRLRCVLQENGRFGWVQEESQKRVASVVEKPAKQTARHSLPFTFIQKTLNGTIEQHGDKYRAIVSGTMQEISAQHGLEPSMLLTSKMCASFVQKFRSALSEEVHALSTGTTTTYDPQAALQASIWEGEKGWRFDNVYVPLVERCFGILRSEMLQDYKVNTEGKDMSAPPPTTQEDSQTPTNTTSVDSFFASFRRDSDASSAAVSVQKETSFPDGTSFIQGVATSITSQQLRSDSGISVTSLLGGETQQTEVSQSLLDQFKQMNTIASPKDDSALVAEQFSERDGVASVLDQFNKAYLKRDVPGEGQTSQYKEFVVRDAVEVTALSGVFMELFAKKCDTAYSFYGLAAEMAWGMLQSVSIQIRDVLFVVKGEDTTELFATFLETLLHCKKEAEFQAGAIRSSKIFFVTFAKSVQSDACLTSLFSIFFERQDAEKVSGEYLFFSLFNLQLGAAYLGIGDEMEYWEILHEVMIKPRGEKAGGVPNPQHTQTTFSDPMSRVSLHQLPRVAKRLCNKLRENNLLDITLEDCGMADAITCQTDPLKLSQHSGPRTDTPFPSVPYHHILLSKFPEAVLDNMRTSSKALSVLCDLCVWRENICRGRIKFPFLARPQGDAGVTALAMRGEYVYHSDAIPMVRVLHINHDSVIHDKALIQISQMVQNGSHSFGIDDLIAVGMGPQAASQWGETVCGIINEAVKRTVDVALPVEQLIVSGQGVKQSLSLAANVDYIAQHLQFEMSQGRAGVFEKVLPNSLASYYNLLDLVSSFETSLKQQLPLVLPQEWMGWRYAVLLPQLLPVLEGHVERLFSYGEPAFNPLLGNVVLQDQTVSPQRDRIMQVVHATSSDEEEEEEEAGGMVPPS